PLLAAPGAKRRRLKCASASRRSAATSSTRRTKSATPTARRRRYGVIALIVARRASERRTSSSRSGAVSDRHAEAVGAPWSADRDFAPAFGELHARRRARAADPHTVDERARARAAIDEEASAVDVGEHAVAARDGAGVDG